MKPLELVQISYLMHSKHENDPPRIIIGIIDKNGNYCMFGDAKSHESISPTSPKSTMLRILRLPNIKLRNIIPYSIPLQDLTVVSLVLSQRTQ